MTEEKKKESGPRNAGVVLASLEDGQLLVDLGVKIQRLGQELGRVADHAGKSKGSIVLRLDMKAERGGVVTIHTDIKVTDPKPPREASIRWLLPDGNLSVSNPKQQLLPLREVPKAKDAVPHDAETGEVQG